MENQIFWTPPQPARRNIAAQSTPLLPSLSPPLLSHLHESSDATSRPDAAPTCDIATESHAFIQGQTADDPICIPSDIDSEEDGIRSTIAEDNNEQHLGFSSWLKSDETLPPIEEILAPPIKAPCGSTRIFESLQLGSEDSREAGSTTFISKQPSAPQDGENPITSADMSTMLTTDDIAVHPVAQPPPVSILMDLTSPTQVEPTARETTASVTDVEHVHLAESPIKSDLRPVRRRSPRISAISSDMRRNLGGLEGSVTPVSRSSSAALPHIPDENSQNGELPNPRDALEDDSSRDHDSDLDSDCHLGSDSDDCRDTCVLHDEDYTPSLPDCDDGKQQDDCHHDGADERPRKRRRTRRSMADTRSLRASSTCLTAALVKPSKNNRHAPTAGLRTPPPSLASNGGEDHESQSATFEEWAGTVKLTTINGVTTFEGQFDGDLSLNLLQALVQTWSATQKTLPPACGKTRVVGSSRSKFTPEEDDLIVELKAELNLSWSDIHRRFCNQFPGRSKGSLQVRYCTKLKDRR